MNIVYKDLVFPFKNTNLERIIDGKYFKINTLDHKQELHICLDNEQMLLEFSKSLKASCSLMQDYETDPFIEVNINLDIFVDGFNERYSLSATIEQ